MPRISKAEKTRRAKISRGLIRSHAVKKAERTAAVSRETERLANLRQLGWLRWYRGVSEASRQQGVSFGEARDWWDKASKEIVLPPERIPIPPPTPPPLPEREPFVFNLQRTNEDLPSDYRSNTDISILLNMRDPINPRIVIQSIRIYFNTGANHAEFWSNYFAAVRQWIDDTWGTGEPRSGKGKSPNAIMTVGLAV